ncbi:MULTISPECIES: DUF7134 domain-containing protein [Streptomyces violaceusniger group]|uniref:DUF7134 domain-containing protein n=1 Tax=Streptomyces rhizosphaericus TaxID=114699 RepID=A0ABN1SQ47_9ACTN|nr:MULTISPECIES: hypothetical protein [Streptomyces violaceusniger group]
MLIVAMIGLTDFLSGSNDAPFGQTEGRGHLQAPAAVPYVVSTALIVPLWWRGRAPAPVYFVIPLVTLAQGALGLWLSADLTALIALYTMARHDSLRLLGRATVMAIAQVMLPVFVILPDESWPQGLFILLGTDTAAAAVGLTLRTRQTNSSPSPRYVPASPARCTTSSATTSPS